MPRTTQDAARDKVVGGRTFPSYRAALSYLETRHNLERARLTRLDRREFQLDRMRAILSRLDNPQRGLRCVHVAGSKGKGSVCEMTASALGACGYAVGLYTSPHLMDVRERIRIGGREVGEAELTRLLSQVAAAASAVEGEHGEASYFEVLTAAGLLYFAEQAVDLAVIEVGLGGRLDAMNVVEPDVTVVTEIQLEHAAILGDTLGEIAREKAGIFKPGVRAITQEQKPEVLAALAEAAEQATTALQVLGREIEFSTRFESSPELGPHARVCVSSGRGGFEHLAVPLKGEHQAINCGLALSAIEALRDRGFESSERQVAEGLAATPARGRMELVWHAPRIMVDGAHNPESIHCLVKAIGAHVRYDSMVMVFGCAADKNVDAMLKRVSLGADKVIFVAASDNSRAADPRDLHRRFSEMSGKMTQVAPSVKEALNIAARAVGRDDLICVTGSFYVAGEAKRLLLSKKG